MSAHTKTRLTRTRRLGVRKRKAIPWREAYKEELRKYGEAGLMLRGSRHKAEMTQQELADKLEISQHHVSEMENGKRPIGKIMALRLGKFFKTDYRKFL
jgi:plasmid maintenance system antidote protein VapI